MKFISATKEGYNFQLSPGEVRLLNDLLKLYPLTPDSIHRISKNPDLKEIAQSQKLLNEELADHRRISKSWLSAWIDQNLSVDLTSTETILRLKESELELLLQVFNDIRIGSWMLLGSPTQEQREDIEPTRQNHALICIMDMCGAFQMSLMNATSSPPQPEDAPQDLS